MEMQFCSECGSAPDEHGVCSNKACKTRHPYRKGQTKTSHDPQFASTSGKKFTEKGKKIVPDCIQADKDEVHIKQYDIARLQTLIKGARAEGRLQVTNKRLIFRASGFSVVGATSLQHEFSIEEIAGIEIRKEARINGLTTILLILLLYAVQSILNPIFSAVYNYKLLGTIFTLLLAAAAAFLFFLFSKQPILRYIILCVIFSGLPLSSLRSINNLQSVSLIVVAVFLFISMLYMVFAPNLVIRILTKGGTPSVEIRRKDSIFSFQHNEYTGFAQVMPGPDTDLAMKELGAVIREVQQTGTYNEK